MGKITTLLWDVGGVLLTNGWDRTARHRAVERFHLDAEEFETRHAQVVAAFETGQISLEEYLGRCVFYQPHPFSQEAFKAFMFEQSQPHAETLALLDRLTHPGNYLLAALNNEALELNQYRIERFQLRQYFTAFFTSCFLGVRKPEEAIYHKTLQILQRSPEECLFIDDRAENLEYPRMVGMTTIHYQDPARLWEELRGHGVTDARE